MPVRSRVRRSARRPRSTPSPKPSSASCLQRRHARRRRCGPDAVTTSVSPNRAPSDTSRSGSGADRLRRPPAFATRTSASNPRTASTNRAAGRACRPISLRTASSVAARRPARPPAPASGAPPGSLRSADPQLRGLHRQRPARLGRHLVQRRPAARRDRRRDRALDQRRARSAAPARRRRRRASRPRTRRSSARCRDPSAPARRRRTSPARSPPARARRRSPARLALRSRRPPRAASSGPDHLPRERDDALGQRGAVGDDDDPDHRNRRRATYESSP